MIYKFSKIRLTVFVDIDTMMIRNAFSELDQLISKYDKSKIYNLSNRSSFYFYRMAIILKLKDLKEINIPKKSVFNRYKIDFVDKVGYESISNSYVYHIDGSNPRIIRCSNRNLSIDDILRREFVA